MRVFVLIFLMLTGNVFAAMPFHCAVGYVRLASRPNYDLRHTIAEQRYYWEKEAKRGNPQINFFRGLGIDVLHGEAPDSLEGAVAKINSKLDQLVASGRFTEEGILRPDARTSLADLARWRYFFEHPNSMATAKRGELSRELLPIRDHSRPDFEEFLRRYGIKATAGQFSLASKTEGELTKMYVDLRQRYYDFIDPIDNTNSAPDLLPENLLKKPDPDKLRQTLTRFLEHVQKGL